VAFVVRLVYALTLAPDLPPFGDSTFFHENALHLADGRGYVEGFLVPRPTAAHPPLYSFGLAAIAWIGGRSVDAQRILGVFAGTGTVLMVGLIAARLAGRRAAVIAAALCAFYPAFIAADSTLMSETLFGFFVAWAMLQALRQLETPSPWGMALLGALIGASALTRSEGLLFVPMGLALALLAAPRRQRGLRAAALLAATLVLIGPWVARNQHVFGRPVFTTNEGTTLAGSNCDLTYYGKQIGDFTEACLPGPPPDQNAAEVSNHRRRAAFRYIDRHSGRAVLVAGVRVLRMWGFWAVNDQKWLEGRDSGLQTAGAIVLFPLLVLAAAGGVILYARRRRAELLVVLAPICVSTLTAALTYGLQRLRHISEISVLILAGVAITAAVRARSSESARASPPSGSPAARRA
jgi:4-amino-4-deoxy-L-arabinose transferase-like glycosyltransferase